MFLNGLVNVIFVAMVFFMPLHVSMSYAYEPKVKGTALFTETQRVSLIERKNNTSGLFISTQDGFFGDWNHIKAAAVTFMDDVKNNGGDSGRWDNFSDVLGDIGVLPGNNTVEPRPMFGAIGAYSVSDNIHYAAIIANLDNNQELAAYVFKELLAVANDDKLDSSNGTSKTNDTFGTTIRFNYSYSGADNPWFISAAKITKYIESYGLIYRLIENDPVIYNATDVQRVEQFFADWHDFIKTISANYITGTLGPNWRNNQITLGDYQKQFLDLATDNSQPYTHYDQNNVGFNHLTRMQASAFNNRVWDFIELVHTYGIYFGDADSRNLSSTFFKLFLKLCIFPDGTQAEWYRAYNSSATNSVGKPTQGFNYTYLTLAHVVKFAQTHAIAAHNGIPGVTDAGYYYDYVTSEGTDELIDDYPQEATSTSGGHKGIYQMLINQSKYHRPPSHGGFEGLRFSERGLNNSPNIVFNGDQQVYSVVPAMANTYYQTDELRDYAFFSSGAGYPGPISFTSGAKNWGAWAEHSWGAWGTAYGIGLYLDVNNVFHVEEEVCFVLPNKDKIAHAVICL